MKSNHSKNFTSDTQTLIGFGIKRTSVKLIRSEVFSMNIQYFRVLMKRLALQYAGGWFFNDEMLVFSECGHNKNIDETLSKYGSWEVSSKGVKVVKGWGGAGIEAYEQPDGTTAVNFYDGYHPAKPSDLPPIGAAFVKFCEMIVKEARAISDKQAKPQADSGTVGGQLTPAEDEGGKVEIFYAYAREDEDLRDELEKHLRMLEREGVITSWHDRKIGAGKEWEGEIDTHLNTARVILLLISPDFIASDYCWDVEMKRAMERHEAGEARVIPVILRPVDWKGALFGKLQALPTDAKPVTSWANRDEAFLDVAQGIRAAVEELATPKAKDEIVPGLTRRFRGPVGVPEASVETTGVKPPGRRGCFARLGKVEWVILFSILFAVGLVVRTTGVWWVPWVSRQPTPVPRVDVRVIPGGEPLVRVVQTEQIDQPNCGGTLEVENVLERSRKIKHTIELEGSVEVNAKGEVGLLGTGVQVGTAIAVQYGQSYGTEDILTRAITVKAKEGTNMEHTIQQVEIWQLGTVEITIGGQQFTYPYHFRNDFSVELVESQNIGCPPTEEVPSTPTAIPTTPRGNACDLPLITATATVEVTIASSEDINTTYITAGAYVAFYKGNESLLVMKSKECTARQTGNEQVVYRADDANMDVSDAAFGEPMRLLEQAEYIQIRFLPMPEQSQVIEGKITCIFNSETPLEVSIPAQDTTEGKIFVRGLDINCGSD